MVNLTLTWGVAAQQRRIRLRIGLPGITKLTEMRIFLTGVSCVGKTTVGKKLAAMVGCTFFDLDQEITFFDGVTLVLVPRRNDPLR